MAQNYHLGHVHLKVSNLERSTVFYTELLGFKVTEKVNNYLFLTYGDKHHELALQEVPDGKPVDDHSLGLYHFAIELPDLEELKSLYNRLESAGVLSRPVNHGISKVIYFKDPDGNGIEAYIDTRKQNKCFEWKGTSKPLDFDKIS